MATYEFWCPKCKKEFEVKRPMSDFDKPASCPDCGTQGGKLVSNFASNLGSTMHVPEKQPFRKKE
ncbi:MAG: zinc ribbon domain-containing protein [Chloroflexota bacterium]|nr:zinc ribbon domain-containing protein [Chloroflexota bacterium]